MIQKIQNFKINPREINELSDYAKQTLTSLSASLKDIGKNEEAFKINRLIFQMHHPRTRNIVTEFFDIISSLQDEFKIAFVSYVNNEKVKSIKTNVANLTSKKEKIFIDKGNKGK